MRYFAFSLLVTQALCAAPLPSKPQSSPSLPPPPPPENVMTQPKGVITPPTSPRVVNGLDLFVDADFLWVKSEVSGLAFANAQGKVKSPPASFEPGFRVGIGMDMGFDGWDTYMQYTWESQPWLTSSFHNKDPLAAYFIYADKDTGALSSPLVSQGSVSRKQQFNVLDLELGREFFISRKLTLRPLFGFKLAKMFEKTKIEEKGEGFISKTDLFFQQTLSGVGARAGLDTVWYLTKHLGLYGDVAVTALWSGFHNNASMRIEDSKTTSVKERSQTVLPVIEMNLGAMYRVWFYNEAYELYVKAGWQEEIWVGYNHNAINGDPNNTGNLSIHGLDVKVGFAF